MQEQLNHLVALQEMDNTIRQVLQDLERLPEEIRSVDKEVQEAEASFQQFLRELEELKKKRKSLERDIEELDQKIKKSQIRMMEVKTNKEYKAMLLEMEELKKAKEGLEDLLLDLMEKTESGIQEEKKRKKELEEKRTAGKEKKERLERKGKEEEQRLTGLKTRREELSSLLAGDLLKQYEYLRSRLHGLAVAEVKNGTCLGCHMYLPPQLYNELHRQDRILTCPTCLRILHFDPTSPNGKD